MIAEIKTKSIFVFNLFVVWIFFLLRLLRVSINPPCTETKYCYHVMAGAFYCYFDELDRLQNRVYRAAEPWLVVCLQPLVYFRHLASLRLFYRYYLVNVRVNWLNWSHSLILVGVLLSILIDCIISVTIARCYSDVYVNSFSPRTARLWNCLLIECFPLTYDQLVPN